MMKPFVHNRRSWGKPFWVFRNRFVPDPVSGLPKKPRSAYTDAVHPYKLDVVGARSAQCLHSAQAFAKLARTEAVRADHRLRTDDEAIRAQSTIWG
jgi:hypothetical protein